MPYETTKALEAIPSTDLVRRLDIRYLSENQQIATIAEAERFITDALVSNDGSSPNTEIWSGSLDRFDEYIQHKPNVDGKTPPLADAYRLMVGTMVEGVSDLERRGEVANARHLSEYINSYLETTSITTYCGTTADRFRLLTLAQATPETQRLAYTMAEIFAIDTSFPDPTELNPYIDTLQSGTALEQLQAIRALDEIMAATVESGGWAEPSLNKAISGLLYLSEQETIAPLVRKVAEITAQHADEIAREEWGGFEIQYISEESGLFQGEQNQQFIHTEAEQRKLRNAYPHLGDDAYIQKISSDTAATRTYTGFGLLEYHLPNGRVVIDTADTVQGSKNLGLNAEQNLLLTELHQPYVKELIETDLGVKLTDISLHAQLHLLEYMATAGGTTYDRLGHLISSAPEDARAGLAETFLSLEFGKDYGDLLLDADDRFAGKPEELRQFLGNLQGIRDNSRRITARFEGTAPQELNIPAAIEKSIIHRSTELLALATQGTAKEQEEARETMRLVNFATNTIATGLEGTFSPNTSESDTYATFRSARESIPLTLTIRPDGDNPRIGFTINMPRETLPEALLDTRIPGKDRRNRRLSFRLDFNDDGQLSFDMGSTIDANVSPVGRFVGAALHGGKRKLAEYRHGATDQVEDTAALHGHHVTEHLPAVTPETFYDLTRRFADRLGLQHQLGQVVPNPARTH